jgi:hypothetical protein
VHFIPPPPPARGEHPTLARTRYPFGLGGDNPAFRVQAPIYRVARSVTEIYSCQNGLNFGSSLSVGNINMPHEIRSRSIRIGMSPSATYHHLMMSSTAADHEKSAHSTPTASSPPIGRGQEEPTLLPAEERDISRRGCWRTLGLLYSGRLSAGSTVSIDKPARKATTGHIRRGEFLWVKARWQARLSAWDQQAAMTETCQLLRIEGKVKR